MSMPSSTHGYHPLKATGFSAASPSSASRAGHRYTPTIDFSPTPLSASSHHASANPWSTYAFDNEPDDDLHALRPGEKDRGCHGIDWRGAINLLFLFGVLGGILMLFAGYPLLRHYLHNTHSYVNLNSSGQVASLPNLRQLIDPDTPASAYHWTSPASHYQYDLVFSDEFELDGRTFYPGDDPFWEAVDIWYGATGDYEWYSPEQVNTSQGALTIALIQKDSHNLNFQSGMLQSWNKFCFQGGYLVMSAKLPGTSTQRGWWPGLWTMGNLGRPGYLGSTEGAWPYSYDSCNWGTLANQTNPQGTGPLAALNAHGAYSYQYDNKLSFLPGQRMSACTCPGEDHPGPHVGVGRSAPEIDLAEVQNQASGGRVSQSMQTAPFDASYWWHNATAELYNDTTINSYTGSVWQEAVSGVAVVPDEAYHDDPAAQYTEFAIEYEPDFDGDGANGFITWYVGKDSPTWTAPASTMQANSAANITQRLIPREPMTIVMNLGMCPHRPHQHS